MAASSWKRDFASGLVVLVPLLVTLYVLLFLYSKLAAPLGNIITEQTLRNLGVDVAALGAGETAFLLNFLRVTTILVVFVVLVFSVGYLMRTALGDIFERTLDDLMNRVPGLRVVYNASKMAVETALTGTEELQRPVKIELWDGVRLTAFKTGKSTADGRDVLFLPTAPNVTTGFVIEVDAENYEATDERVEDALTRILSAGFGDNEAETTPFDIDAGEESDGESGAGVEAED